MFLTLHFRLTPLSAVKTGVDPFARVFAGMTAGTNVVTAGLNLSTGTTNLSTGATNLSSDAQTVSASASKPFLTCARTFSSGAQTPYTGAQTPSTGVSKFYSGKESRPVSTSYRFFHSTPVKEAQKPTSLKKEPRVRSYRFVDQLRIRVQGGAGGQGIKKLTALGGKGGDVYLVGKINRKLETLQKEDG